MTRIKSSLVAALAAVAVASLVSAPAIAFSGVPGPAVQATPGLQTVRDDRRYHSYRHRYDRRPMAGFDDRARPGYDLKPQGYDYSASTNGVGGYKGGTRYIGGLAPGQTTITASPGSAGSYEQQENRRNFCDFAPSRC